MTERAPSVPYVAVSAFAQERFGAKAFNSLGFNLHSNPAENRTSVAIFVHGWGGKGYGTWPGFLQMLFDGSHCAAMDVAVFNYNSGLKTVITRGSNLDADARRLAAGILELEGNYSNVYIVCHSLGGLVAGEAVSSLLSHKRAWGGPPETGIAGMFLFASPRAGAGLANPLLTLLVREFRWLRRFSARCEKIESFFTEFVQSNAIAHTLSHQFLIPRYAYVGSGDRVVSRFSAAFGIPTTQIMTTTGNHRSIVRPTNDDHPQLTWLAEHARTIEGLRAQRQRELEHAREDNRPAANQHVVVTQLWHDPSIGGCADIYNDVREEVSRDGVLVQDRTELGSVDTKVDLLMTVHNALTVSRRDGQVQRVVVKALAEHRGSDRLTVGVASVGHEFENAKNIVIEWLLPELPSERFYVEGVVDDDALRELMWRWVQRIVRRDPQRRRAKIETIDSFASPGREKDQYFGRTDIL